MQIKFTPHKIKAAKAYIENLYEDEKKVKKREKKKEKLSFFQKIKIFFS